MQHTPLKTSEKPRVILLNHVNYDGTGDFSHLIDIYQEFKNNPIYQDYEFYPVIACDLGQFKKVAGRLKELEVNKKIGKYYFYKDREFKVSDELKNELQQAEQVMLISHSQFYDLEDCQQYLPTQVVYKYIGEHEVREVEVPEKFENHSLGLSEGHQGIKLKRDVQHYSPQAALGIIKQENPEYVSALLQHTQTTDINTFTEDHPLIPAYFNQRQPFIRFLRVLGMQEGFFKNPVVNFSGRELDDTFIEQLKEELKDTKIGAIEIIQKEKAPVILDNPNPEKGTQRIRIFCGYNLTNNSYNALYQQAAVAGVSGDNTFEMAISCGVFPFYHSTNYKMKKDSLDALCKIIETCNEIPDNVKKDYISYFSLGYKLCLKDNLELTTRFLASLSPDENVISKFQQLD